ncbi:MAG: AMP-binding protein, partial [Acetobacteraceae bacterium]
MTAAIPHESAWRLGSRSGVRLRAIGSDDAVGLVGASVPASLVALIGEVARRQPDAMALWAPDHALTYAELQRLIHALGSRIECLAPPGGAVAVLLADDLDVVVAQLAAAAAGRTCLVINAHHPVERLRTVLADASPGLLIADRDTLPADLAGSVPVLFGISTEGWAGNTVPASSAMQAEACFVYYTSGTTGQPKGYARTQARFLARGASHACELRLSSGDRVTSLLSAAVGTTATWWTTAFIGGARFSFLRPDRLGIRGTAAAISAHRPTVLVGIPTVLRLVLSDPAAASRLTDLRAIYLVSEPIQRDELQEWRRMLPPECDVLLSYGMTEANSIAGWILPRDLSGQPDRLPIGYPREDTEFAIVDESGASVPRGEVGAFWVRGAAVSRGEWRDGRIVRGRAIPDPSDPDRLILQTNDLMREQPDGLLMFAGRADDMVKVRGNRVQPSEVEA